MIKFIKNIFKNKSKIYLKATVNKNRKFGELDKYYVADIVTNDSNKISAEFTYTQIENAVKRSQKRMANQLNIKR